MVSGRKIMNCAAKAYAEAQQEAEFSEAEISYSINRPQTANNSDIFDLLSL